MHIVNTVSLLSLAVSRKATAARQQSWIRCEGRMNEQHGICCQTIVLWQQRPAAGAIYLLE